MTESFRIQTVQPMPLCQVTLIHDPDADIMLTSRQAHDADALWRKTNAQRAAQNLPALMNRPLFRPAETEQIDNCLNIRAGVITYHQNLYLSGYVDTGSRDRLLGAGVSVVPICGDGHILVGKRAALVHRDAGKFHVAAGHAHPEANFRSCPDSLIPGVLEELEEEMGIVKKDILRLEFLGIGINTTTAKTEFLTRVFLIENADAYIDRWKSTRAGQLDGEFDELTTLQNKTTERIQSWNDLSPFTDHFTTACQMALQAHFNTASA